MKSFRKLFLLVLLFFGFLLIAGCGEPPLKPSTKISILSFSILIVDKKCVIFAFNKVNIFITLVL